MPIRRLLIASLLWGLGAGGALARVPAGVWEGELARGDVAMPVRLVVADGRQPTVRFDMPDLVYAEEPVPLAATAAGATVTLPFGLGDFALQQNGDALTATRGAFSLNLHRGARAPYTRETVSLEVEGARLTGEYYRPTGRGPHPAILIAGGSVTQGAEIAWGTRSWCDLFARQGMHCLVYARRSDVDERGVASTLVRDARDLDAVVQALLSKPGVDPARLGVFARSRGVWIAAESAARNPAIKYLILSGVPATTPAEQEIQSAIFRLRRAGRSDAEVADAVAYERLYFSVAHTREGWPQLEAAATAAQQEPWGEFVDQPRTLDDLNWWHANGDYDPRTSYGALRIPIYAFWGGDDAVTPPSVHEPLLRTLMHDNAQLETRVFAEGDHRGEITPVFDRDHWRWFALAPGMVDSIQAWLRQRGFAEAAR